MTDETDQPKDDVTPARGASPAEQDALRALVKRVPREGSQPVPVNAAVRAGAPEVNALIEEGRAVLEADPAEAHAKFEQAWLKDRNDARALSHYGLTLVLVEKDRHRGISFCEQAARLGAPVSERLINLARALVATRNKEQAVRALRKASELAPDDPRVSREFAALGLRRSPPISFLPRDLFLNRWLGRFTWWLSRRRESQGKVIA